MATTIRARIYAREEVSFAKFLFLPSWFAKLLEANFFCQNYMDAKLVCQTVGVALRVMTPLSAIDTCARNGSRQLLAESIIDVFCGRTRPTFLLFSLFCERFSQVDPFWKDFKKWTLSSAPWIMAPSLHASAPQIMAPRSWA
jgi:hypothetical protein